jgi:hypothetical protein
MDFMTLEAFWDAANVVLAHRDQPQMLFGEARDAYASYMETRAQYLEGKGEAA